METGEVAAGSLVVSGGDASPCLQPVDQGVEGVPLLVESRRHGLRADHLWSLPCPGRPPSYGVCAGGRGFRGTSTPCPRRPRPAGCGDGRRAEYPYLPQGGDELRAVRCLACGQDERQRAALAVGGEVDLAGLPASGSSEEGGLQREFRPTPDASSFFQRGITFGLLPVVHFEAAPFGLTFSSSAAALLQGGDHVLVEVQPGCVVVGSGGGGVDADQGEVHLTPLRGFRDQAFQQGPEDAGVTPLPEVVWTVDQAPNSVGISRHCPG